MFDAVVEQLVSEHILTFSGYEEENWTKPNVNFATPSEGIWVRVQVDNSYSSVASITDNPLIESAGLITFQVFDQENNGTWEVKAFTDALADHMALLVKQNLFLGTPTTRHVGAVESWYQVNLIIPYEYYGAKTL